MGVNRCQKLIFQIILLSKPPLHTDPVCEFFSKNYLMAKLLQNNSNLNDLEYSRHLKVRKIEKKAKKNLKAKQRPEVKKPKFS